MREPTEMEERVARAICNVSNRAPWADENYDLFLDEARAAIRAMREPTFRMIDKGATSSDEICMYPEDVWIAMIDAASPGDE